MSGIDPKRTLKRPLDETGASHHRAAEPRPPYLVLCVVCSVIAHILKGTTMRSILGLVVAVVVIVLVLRFMGVL